MKTKQFPTSAIAACSFEIQADGAAIQLFPAGAFKARDGRPTGVKSGHWLIDSSIAARLIARMAARMTDVVIDYEHQTLNSAENGKEAPPAGWFKGVSLEWREGVGLFATPVEWTERGGNYVKGKEYRYLSPVFAYDKQIGAVLDLLHVGLTNYPAIDDLQPLQAMAAARFQMADPATPVASSAISRFQVRPSRPKPRCARRWLLRLKAWLAMVSWKIWKASSAT